MAEIEARLHKLFYWGPILIELVRLSMSDHDPPHDPEAQRQHGPIEHGWSAATTQRSVYPSIHGFIPSRQFRETWISFHACRRHRPADGDRQDEPAGDRPVRPAMS